MYHSAFFKISIVLLLSIPMSTVAQNATIVLDNQTINTNIQSIEQAYIQTDSGDYFFNKINGIRFEEFNKNEYATYLQLYPVIALDFNNQSYFPNNRAAFYFFNDNQHCIREIPINDYGELNFKKTVHLPGLSKELIAKEAQRILREQNELWTSKKDFTSTSETVFTVPVKIPLNSDLNPQIKNSKYHNTVLYFSSSIDVKEGKYRIRLSNLVIYDHYEKQEINLKDYFLKRNFYQKNGGLKPNREKLKRAMNQALANYALSIEKELNLNSIAKHQDW